jgi:hypothetical protein
MDRLRLYSIDTSALIDGLERYYPQETFPALWDRVGELVSAGRFVVSEEVWSEARTHDAAAKRWCDAQDEAAVVVPTDAAVVEQVQIILARYPKLVKNLKGRNRADAFVIAVAVLRGGVVVTGEGVNGTQDRPKIPFICAQMGVECIRFLELIRMEGWKF